MRRRNPMNKISMKCWLVELKSGSRNVLAPLEDSKLKDCQVARHAWKLSSTLMFIICWRYKLFNNSKKMQRKV